MSIESSMLDVVQSGTFNIISLGFLCECVCASSYFPHFHCISLPRMSVSSFLFISIRTPPLKDFTDLIPTLISPGFILVLRICLISYGWCALVDLTVTLYVLCFIP